MLYVMTSCTGYWSVDAKAETAMGGSWKKGPGQELFDALKAKLGKVPILAEDLGVITSDVVELRCVLVMMMVVVFVCVCVWGGA
jgi:4-alpha-glucanotransferase